MTHPTLTIDANTVNFLVELAQKRGLNDMSLDKTIYDVASAAASDANNGGLYGQAEFLIELMGYAAAKQIIEDAAT